jgi:D-alanine-D-alanine ligase
MLSSPNPADVPVLLLYSLVPEWAPHEKEEAIMETHRLGAALSEYGHPVTAVAVTNPDIAAPLSGYHSDDHVVFNWCEQIPGVPRSEAEVARSIEALHYVYTGADASVLALSEDKPRVKTLLYEHHIPTPRWQLYDHPQPITWNGFPAIVKPAYEHCSVGITPQAVVMTGDELQERINYVLQTFRQPALVEDFIDGREFHVSLWGNGRVEMLPPAEMDFSAFSDFHERLCTYESKFDPDSAHYKNIETLLPAPLDDHEYDLLGHTARAAYSLLGCRDYGRIDMRLRDGVFYVLDVNPNPDISADASMALAAELIGYPYGVMASCVVRLAAQRHPLLRSRLGLMPADP